VTLSLSPSTLSLFVGETGSLAANVSGLVGATVNFTSSATSVATVSGSGQVTAVSLGSATITAIVAGEGVSATAQVTVNPATIAVTPVTAEVGLGGTVQLTAQVSGGVGLAVTWTSADLGVATVDQTGLVTGVAAGTVSVSASVDGQAGVSDAADITVTAPPAVTAARILDAQGQPADLSNIGDLLIFEFDLEGEVGDGGRIDILVDGAVLASQEFVIEAAAGVPPSIAAVRGSRTERILASTPVVSFDGSTIAEIAPRGEHDIAAVLATTPGVSTVSLNGQSSVRGTFRQTPRLFIRGATVPSSDPLFVVNGRPVANGDIILEGQLAFDPGDIASIEVLRGASGTAIYGSAANNGVVLITLKGSDANGTEGPTLIQSVEAQTGGGQVVPMLLGTPDLVRGQPLPPIPDLDRKDPTYGGSFDAEPGYIVGTDTDLTASLSIQAEWSATKWGDYSGIATRRFDAAPESDPSNWSYSDVTLGSDLSGLDGVSFRLSDVAVDPFGQFRRQILLDRSTGLPLMIYADLSHPNFSATSSGIADGTLGVVAGTPFQFHAVDPTGQNGSLFSGIDLNSAAGQIEYLTPSGSTFLLGSADGPAAAPDAFGTGYLVDFPALGPGVAFTRWGIGDRAGNRWSLDVRAAYDPVPPSTTGLDVSVTFNPAGEFTLNATLADNLDLLYAASGFRYTGLAGGQDLTLIPNAQTIGTPFNRQFVTDFNYSATVSGVASWIEETTTSFPFEPNGTKAPLASARVGGFDIGGLFGDAEWDASAIRPAAGPSFLATGTDNLEGTASPPWLCNRALVSDCSSIPEQASFGALSYTSNTFPFTEAQLWAQKGLSNGEVVAIPLSERIAGVRTDFSGFSQLTWSATVNATTLGLGPEITGAFWLMYTDNGEALKTQTKSLGILGGH
jgi:TonB-dependent SusC/RagA subfamily outer membrane receptor